MEKFKIGMIHPELTVAGGSEALALYIAEVPKDDNDVTIVLAYLSNLDKPNKCYGTNIPLRIFAFFNILFHFFLKGSIKGVKGSVLCTEQYLYDST